MGRSIPSFRMLIDIERLEWKTFRENLSNRQDKQYFNKLFSIPKLYCNSLSNLSKPINMEPILLSVLFQSFKENDKLLYKSTESTISSKSADIAVQKNIKSRVNFTTSVNSQIGDKDYNFAQLLREWKEFSDCLSKEDESIFIEMITRCYDSYHLAIDSYNNIQNGKIANTKKEKGQQRSSVRTTTSLFMALYLYQQKQLNYMKSNQRQLDFYV